MNPLIIIVRAIPHPSMHIGCQTVAVTRQWLLDFQKLSNT
jgi:hypothetical protein